MMRTLILCFGLLCTIVACKPQTDFMHPELARDALLLRGQGVRRARIRGHFRLGDFEITNIQDVGGQESTRSTKSSGLFVQRDTTSNEWRMDREFSFHVKEEGRKFAHVYCVLKGRSGWKRESRVIHFNDDGLLSQITLDSHKTTTTQKFLDMRCRIDAYGRRASLSIEQNRVGHSTYVDGSMHHGMGEVLITDDPGKVLYRGWAFYRADGSPIAHMVIDGNGLWLAPDLSDEEERWLVAVASVLMYSGRSLTTTVLRG